MANFDTRRQQELNKLTRLSTPFIANRLLILLIGGGILWFMLVTIPVRVPLFSLSWPGGTQQIPLGEAPNGKIKIAFVSDRDGYNNIFVMNSDGSGVRKLTHSATESEYTIGWSPDGEKIAFIRRGLGDGNASIYVMNADGTNQTRITSGALAFSELAWSPDGEKIAFSRSDGVGTGDIYVINADGSNQARLTTSVGSFKVYVGTPVWSPDGEKIAFSRKTVEVTDTGGSASASAPVYEMSGLYVVNANGIGEIRLTDATAGSGFAWSLDGEKIAFTQPGMSTDDIFVMDSDGSGQTRLTNSSADESGLIWSPDGEKIAFTRDDALGSADIFVMNSDGSGQTRLTNSRGGSEGIVTWSPDGEKILFWAPDATENFFSDAICVFNADGTDRRCLVDFGDDVSSASVIWTRAQ